MLYVIFILAVVVTILYFTDPEFILRHKFRGKDLYKILSDEEHNNALKLLGRGIQVLFYSLVYYPATLIAVPLIILWAISKDVGFQIVSFIAAGAVIILLGQFGYWIWKIITGNKGKADIVMDDGTRYRGKVLSESKVVGIKVSIRDIGEDIHLEGIFLDEDDDKVRLVSSNGLRTVYKNEISHMEKETSIHAEVELKDGSIKIGKRIHILGEKPFKDFLRHLPDLVLTLYLWYLVVTLLIS